MPHFAPCLQKTPAIFCSRRTSGSAIPTHEPNLEDGPDAPAGGLPLGLRVFILFPRAGMLFTP